ncbi:hypothetical protein Tcan_15938 [Toxocara canis]|uniref:Uncharacterized protein n=1 Tax=Toxocara canis TaxID=6265 RepID=A0A0B2VF00_TOXCA|nr:hypothetical protein Tcan_15938 [Toxocara canis]
MQCASAITQYCLERTRQHIRQSTLYCHTPHNIAVGRFKQAFREVEAIRSRNALNGAVRL